MTKPYLGFGLGLRKEHYQAILETQPELGFLEILTENYMIEGGKPLYYLDKLRQDYPMVMHGVSMSLGSVDPINKTYLNELKQLIDRVEPKWISDHLCWTGMDNKNMHDLLPLPYTEEAVNHMADKISQVQDYLGQQILVENLSSYITYTDDSMSEWEYLSAVANKADCNILLDVNNIYVSSYNHHFDPMDYINGIDSKRVWQHHLAGHTNDGNLILDTHDQDIIDPVWSLYEQAAKTFGPVSTMIERDGNIPALEDVLKELDQAKQIATPYYD